MRKLPSATISRQISRGMTAIARCVGMNWKRESSASAPSPSTMMNIVTSWARRNSGRKRAVISPRSRATALKPSASCSVIVSTIGAISPPWPSRGAGQRGLYGRPSSLPNHARMVRLGSLSFMMRTGGQILVDNLVAQGVELAFCVPGESYLPVLDALYDAREKLRLIVCRQEGGAAYMAEAYGKLTGRPGIVFVTRGPGASNAAIGIHTAAQDSTPLIVFVGQVGSDFADREAFQEIDYRRMFGSIAKWVAQIDRVERVPEYVARAFRIAQWGRPGPAVLALPEDMLAATAGVSDATPVALPAVHPSPSQLGELRSLLAAAKRPLVIAGGSGWSAGSCADLARFVEANALPVACA